MGMNLSGDTGCTKPVVRLAAVEDAALFTGLIHNKIFIGEEAVLVI
jgi:hypothetical protein